MSPWKLLAPTPIMNRPVGASSTEVTMSANDRLGNGSLRSGLTSVMFMPGILGNDAGGSPAPTGADGRIADGRSAARRPGRQKGRRTGRRNLDRRQRVRRRAERIVRAERAWLRGRSRRQRRLPPARASDPHPSPGLASAPAARRPAAVIHHVAVRLVLGPLASRFQS